MMPLHDLIAAAEPLEQAMVARLTIHRDLVHSDFTLFREPYLAAQRLGQKLVTETEADIRLAALHHPFTDGLDLSSEPGVLLELPHIHGPAQDEHQVEVLERGNLLAFPQSDRFGLNTVGNEE